MTEPETVLSRYAGLESRVAVVTGAARGIGRAVADLLAANGAKVALLDLHVPDDVETVQRDINTTFEMCDVTDEDAIDRAIGAVEAAWGRVDVLVNNAGVLQNTSLLQTTKEQWDLHFAVNSTGPFLCAKRVVPGMKAAGFGRIITIGSSAGKTGGSGSGAAYAASKAAAMCLAKSLASDLATSGITSNALAPTLIDTEMIASLTHLKDHIPVGRFGRPIEVAALVAFLASEEAGYITGEVVDINGGFLID